MRISDWSSDVCSSDLHDHAIEIRPQPFDDLLHTRLLAATFPRAERGVSGEQHALAEPDVRPLAEARERRYQQAFLTECRPVALRIFKQAVRYRNPDRAAAALEPVVANDARELAPFARAGAVAHKPSAPELHVGFGLLRRGRDDIEHT